LLVPKAGLEPARVAPLPPQDSVSTCSTTSAVITLFLLADLQNPDLYLQARLPLSAQLQQQVSRLPEEFPLLAQHQKADRYLTAQLQQEVVHPLDVVRMQADGGIYKIMFCRQR